MPPRSLFPSVADLYSDVQAVLAESLPWDSVVPAERSLPSGGPVEAWYLAGFFLRTWANEVASTTWKRVMAEGPRGAFSEDEELPQTSEDPAAALAGGLAQDDSLDPLLAGHVELLASSLFKEGTESRHPGGLVRAAVETHEWCVLLALLAEQHREYPSRVAAPSLARLRRSLGNLARATREFAYSLSDPQLAYATELITNYRNATLAFSWMPYCQGDREFGIEDPLFPDEKEKAVNKQLLEQVARELESVRELPGGLVRAIVERIANAVLQRGFDAFAEDISMPGSLGELDGYEDGALFNVIPGDEPGKCAPLLIAVAHAGSRTGMSKILPQVRKHLIDCDPNPRAVIIVSDEWNPKILGDSLGDLKSHVAKGKKFVFLLAPQPGRGLVHMPISLK
jgi:hypothetical protein